MPTDAPVLMTTDRLAEYLEVTPQALANMRMHGTGPKYIKVGRGIRYRWVDVETWMHENTHQSTDEHTDQPGTFNAKTPA